MQSFQVLDRDLPIRRHYLLEASAGTGKTFSIQNIVVRLLIDKEPVPLNRILVVTFTRAATRELRQRIRTHIEQSLNDIRGVLSGEPPREGTPDYLLAVMEKSTLEIERTKRLLQQALSTFDTAHIYTIHGFCSRMLREHTLECSIGTQAKQNVDNIPQAVLKRVMGDYFNTEIRPETITPGQLSIYLKRDPEQRQLQKLLTSPHDVEDTSTAASLFKDFQLTMQSLKSTLHLNSSSMIADFEMQATDFKNARKDVSKTETLSKIKSFAALFDKTSWDLNDFDRILLNGLVWTEALDPKLLKKKTSTPILSYPNLTETLKEKLEPIILQASDFPCLLARMAKECRSLLKRYQHSEETFFPDDLLRKMSEALQDVFFNRKVHSLFDAAIIDEFQDTDPIQWNIFKTLFTPSDNPWKGHLYLVGDPKQSIYSFRQADIYTYLSASNALGKDACFSLDTNYRSHPDLVNALNALFSQDNIPHLIPLPKLKTSLPYRPVKAIKKAHDRSINDGRGAIHFFIGDAEKCQKANISCLEQELFFPFIGDEISKLKKRENISYNSFTVLVRDRYQALRLASYLKKRAIPSLNQRGTNLAESPILAPLIDTLRAVINPKDSSAVKAALGSLLIGWNITDFSSATLESAIIKFLSLRTIWEQEGFSRFFNHLKQSHWKEGSTNLVERLLSLQDGHDLYDDLLQINDIIIENHNKLWRSMDSVIPFLDQFQKWRDMDDESTQRLSNPSREGVKIITLHFSKGLEFDVVFALGLINPVSKQELLIPIQKEDKTVLSSSSNNPKSQGYYEEIDAEKMRQLYVAMTRARTRLYVPLALNLHEGDPAVGIASPIDLFLKAWKKGSFLQFLEHEGSGYHISYSTEEPRNVDHYGIEKDIKPHIPLHQPCQIVIPGITQAFSSFTSLSKPHDDALRPTNEMDRSIKSIHSIPMGKETGIALHTILEKTSFSHVNSLSHAADVAPLISPYLFGTPLEGWEEPVAEIIFHALKSPILCGIDQSKCYREMPFLFPSRDYQPIEGIDIEEGFIKGVIDLIFMRENKYYILDWKSNWLGPDESYYLPENLRQAMENENYFLQAKIYKEALRRYLKIVEPRPFEECFGGALYCFVRGVHQKDGGGVYTIK